MINNEREHIEECSRSRGVDSLKRRVDFIDFPGALQAKTSLFLFVLKKSEKLKTLSVYYNHLLCLSNPTF